MSLKTKKAPLFMALFTNVSVVVLWLRLARHLAFLPKSLMIPGDKCVVGYPVRALFKEVLA